MGERGENLEGLWGELASSFTSLGVPGKLLSLPTICNQLMKLCTKSLIAIPLDTAGGPRWQTLPWQLGVVSAAYNKIMIFDLLTHGDSKIGLSPTNQMDHVVSTEFFDQKQDLKREATRGRVQAWPDSSAARVHRTSYEDFSETPVRLVTKLLMLFPEGKSGVLKLPLKTRGGSTCMSR